MTDPAPDGTPFANLPSQPEDGRFGTLNDPVFERLGICQSCKWQYADHTKCRAFPDGIPVTILVGNFLHTRNYPGDNGIIYVAEVQ